MLYKNAFKLLKKKKFQMIAIGIIIFLSSFIYVAMYNAMNTIQDTLDWYIHDTNQEDFIVKLNNYVLPSETDSKNNIVNLSDLKKTDKKKFDEIINNRKNDLEKQYDNIELELRSCKDIQFEHNGEAYKMRVIKDNKKIDLSYIEEGREPDKDNEIAFPKIFLENNNLKLNDKITINNKTYDIVGEVLVLDYTILIFGKEFIVDSQKITIALTTDNAYEALNGKEELNFAGKFTQKVDNPKEYFDKELPYVLEINDTESNITSGYLFKEVSMGKTTVVGISVMITGIAIIIIGIVLYKLLQGEKGPIGVLKAMGYLNKEIARPYIMLITLVALPMLILGSFVGYLLSKSTIGLFAQFYLFPQENLVNNVSVYLFSILIPLIFFLVLSWIIINKIIQKKPLELLIPDTSTEINKVTILADRILKKCKTVTKFKCSFLLRNKGRFIVYILGIIFASSLIILGLMMPRFFSKLTTDAYENVDYEYQAYVDMEKSLPSINEGEEKFIIINTKIDNHNIVVKGLEPNNKLYKLYDYKSGDEITSQLEENVIVSESFASVLNKNVDDYMTLDINGEEKEFKIAAISNECTDSTVYINREKLSSIYTNGKSTDLFTGIYSDNKIDESKYGSVINKNDILEQSKSMQEFLFVCVGVMLGTSLFIAFLILYVLTSITIEDNYYNISLLKVMGYNKKEVNSMIINSYLGYAVLGYFIALPINVLGMKAFIKYIGNKFDMLFPIQFEWWQMFVGIASMIVIYFIGTLNAKRKIERISLQEILKEYRE